ncbi:hypothetical protein NP233_g5488 [Leucocoprinus birnbaumii]|uniref:Carboxylesterase type B domain-containing protein n=1 Tax=Leucocoprinus birnbaumii TaxID=56174 RepID=A0AAD5VSR5_9AGAR|nr:hypothetical protein NP233_g5488 [Leucocoprinus birnbaumii]
MAAPTLPFSNEQLPALLTSLPSIASMIVLRNNFTAKSSMAQAIDSLNCLRQVDAEVLQQVNVNIASGAFFGTSIWVPVIDGQFITKLPTQLLREGRINGEALLSVTNIFEGTNFVNLNTSSTVRTPSYLANLFPDFGAAQVAKGAAQYANLGSPIDQVIAIMGESIFVCPTYFLLRAFKNKAFKGEFAIPPGLHSDDVVYYFLK